MNSLERIMAVARKEWRLNLRFPAEYLLQNAVSPLKSAVLMFFLYRGLLTKGSQLGMLRQDNYQIFVLVGTTCHSLFLTSISTFRFKMVSEKYWSTIIATLVSPASMLEVIAGFIIGSIGLHICMAGIILGVTAVMFHTPLHLFLTSFVLLLFLCLMGFGIGLIGTTMSLVFEGYSFVFDYASQALVFASCFYYPIETVPAFAHPFIRALPTYQAAQLVQQLYLVGFHFHFWASVAYVMINSALLLCIPALFLDFSIKKYGLVGY